MATFLGAQNIFNPENSGQNLNRLHGNNTNEEANQYCGGKARFLSGKLEQIIDGDTVRVEGESVRFAIVDTPEKGEEGYNEAKEFSRINLSSWIFCDS